MASTSTPTILENEAPAPMSPPPTSPGPSSGRHSPSRKDTILSLVEMLLQESGAAARGAPHTPYHKSFDPPIPAKTLPPSFEDDRDVRKWPLSTCHRTTTNSLQPALMSTSKKPEQSPL